MSRHSQLSVAAFLAQYPHLAIDRTVPLSLQERITSPSLLADYPEVLTASYPVQGSGRGRINPNQTLAHKQCASCGYVKRNDFFYVPYSRRDKGVLSSYCIECTKKHAQDHYEKNKDFLAYRRAYIWNYIAPACVVCGFDTHPDAVEMHGDTEGLLARLVWRFAQEPTGLNAERLLRVAKKHVPLCSNCHRLLHANVLTLPTLLPSPRYSISELMGLRKND